jgi:two-component system chemotaxis sensor kinase CheA
MVTKNPAVVNIEDERFYRATHQLRRICDELQDASMSLRMVPLEGLFKKMVRVVHDLSQKIEKEIDLEIIGGDTEVDKTVIEQISDPLVHIVRNSCDHGLESKEDRIAAGKDPIGKVTIEGRHEGGEVWIIVSDDGGGLNKDKILEKALSNNIITEEDNLADYEIWNLIFHPGFSTADQITNVSGRGVGMDVVKKNVEKLNGRIDIKTTEGKGTSMIIRIPLTLAIIDGMLIKVGESNYTVPTLSIKRSLRYNEDMVTGSPEGNQILRLDETFIPIIHLGNLFGHEQACQNLEEGILIVVDDGSNSLVALFADEIIGQQQTVIKGLSPYINNARGTSGCTILGDGSVALILDIRSLVGMAEEVSAL